MSKKKNIKKVILICIFFILGNLNIFTIETSKANISYVEFMTYSGGLLPKGNVNLSLTSANIIIDADMSNLKHVGAISFRGNYTIFNPDDDINLTIGAPFYFYPPDNITILNNSTSIPYNIMEDYYLFDNDEFEIWNQYLYYRTGNIYGFWVISNLSIPKNTSIQLQYEFNTPEFKHDHQEGFFDIVYDVGTARLWNGNITEKVDIRIKGKLPTSIYYNQRCNISDILDGKSYQWNWKDEIIGINYVGLHYYFNFENEYLFLYNSIRITFILSVSLIGFTFILIKKYSKRKNT